MEFMESLLALAANGAIIIFEFKAWALLSVPALWVFTNM